MTPDEFRHIRDIFEQAVSRPAAEREAFVERECHGDAGMRAEVQRLLEARERVPSWLDETALGGSVPADPPDMAGRHLGGYTLMHEIGCGGMGRVYLAERSDGAFRKQVAIKMVLPNARIAGIMARFRQEREILASLDHPNIARLFDGGVTEEGWPYFVMEYVEGQPIDRWCDEQRLNISQRIELFRGVLAAVRYAHQRLVVHRDLKPGNIFVTRDGTVKLLDFGIAKVLSRETPGEAPETVTLAQMMTPEYASPEQVQGMPISTLSDIYSLGVILYELLTGHRPYRLTSAAMHEMARVIAQVEPTRPSEVVATVENLPGHGQAPITPEVVSAVREGDPERLRKRLSGDLDAILLMALRKEPERRYGSAESFAEDLARHRDNRPIAAREATPWYRFKRLCVRNPSGVAAAVLLAISFFGSGLAVVMQARHDIETALRIPEHHVFLAPVLLFFTTLSVVVFVAFVYFLRPTRRTLLGAAVGGGIWGFAIMCKWWVEHSLGWWHSRLPNTSDPLFLLTPATLVLYLLLATVLLLILSAIGRRYSWRGEVLGLIALSLYQAPREHVWYGTIIPALTFAPGPVPIAGSAAMLAAGGALGLLAMNSFGRAGPAWYGLPDDAEP
jgi:serine/threonine protein kinase